MKRKKVFLMCGVPGSGKSTWVEQRVKESPNNSTVISRDKIRFAILKENAEYFSKEAEVWALFVHNAQSAIDNPSFTNIFIDATHLNEKARNKILDALNVNDCEIIPVYFQMPLHVCLERNRLRSGRAVVPDDVIKNMYRSYKSPTFYEQHTYDNIIAVQENVEIILHNRTEWLN